MPIGVTVLVFRILGFIVDINVINHADMLLYQEDHNKG